MPRDHQPIAASCIRTTGPAAGFDLIGHLLTEQRTLTAVEQFSQSHGRTTEPAQAKYYRDLLPLHGPGPGEQLAFQVDLDSCSGCKACVTACHSLNGLDSGESFREVGLLIRDNDCTAPLKTHRLPVLQHVTTACHHCVDPGCLNACPVNAYEKDPVTGIVRHLDDQCFGCQYCTLACPYSVPKYNAARGIVRKCDMCSQRLAVGEAPACVQACPHQAISINVISIADAMDAAEDSLFLSDSPEPGITIPTTRFLGRATEGTDLHARAVKSPNLEHAHGPLVLLLSLSQIAVGLTLILTFLVTCGATTAADPAVRNGLILACSAAMLSAVASTFHLGRPQFAFRAILGFRHSWLSREILAFGAYVPLSLLAAVTAFVAPTLLPPVLWACAMAGLTGVFCSSMIYHITRRPYWHAWRSLPSFVVGGIGSAALWMTVLFQHNRSIEFHGTLIAVGLSGLCLRTGLLWSSLRWTDRSTHASRTLVGTSTRLRDQLHHAMVGQVVCAMVGAVMGLMSLLTHVEHLPLIAGFTAALAATAVEFVDRYLFFRAVVPLSMPGVSR